MVLLVGWLLEEGGKFKFNKKGGFFCVVGLVFCSNVVIIFGFFELRIIEEEEL